MTTLTIKTLEWMDKHPAFNSDPVYRHKALSLHHDALSQSIAAESEEYWKFVEAGLEARFGKDHGIPIKTTH